MELKDMAPPAPATLPGDLAAHLRLGLGFSDDGAEDALLARYLGAAMAAVETRTGQALLSRGFLLRVTGWDRGGRLVLPVGPVASIDAVRLVGPDGPVPLDHAGWVLAPGKSRQRLAGPAGSALPSVPRGQMVEIEFTAGHGAGWNDIPDTLRQAVLMLTAHYHESRHGDAGEGMPPAVMALLVPHHPVRL